MIRPWLPSRRKEKWSGGAVIFGERTPPLYDMQAGKRIEREWWLVLLIELGTGKVVKIEQKLSPKEHIRRIKEIIRGAKVSGRGK